MPVIPEVRGRKFKVILHDLQKLKARPDYVRRGAGGEVFRDLGNFKCYPFGLTLCQANKYQRKLGKIL